MVRILGISGFYHDSAAAMCVDGRIVAAAQEERFTRKKHDARFPTEAIRYCIEETGIDPSEIDHVAFYDNVYLSFDRLIHTFLTRPIAGFRSWFRDTEKFFSQNLSLQRRLEDEIGWTGDVHLTDHHLSHAASAFYPSPFESAAILTVDGVGEWATASIGYGSGADYELLKELHYPHSLGLLYAAFTYFCGFKVNSGEYKLMGLAPYGEPRYAQLIRDNLVDIKSDGSLRLNLDYFDYLGGRRMINAAFEDLFRAERREPETEIDQLYLDVAASIQQVTEDIMLAMARHAHEVTGSSRLCLAGGVALNCVATGRILREGPFDNIWIQPAAGDAGGAIGAALATYHKHLRYRREIPEGSSVQGGSHWGPGFDSEEIRIFLDENDYPYKELAESARATVVADLLAEGKVLGHFSGRMEFGPRALGARSILGDPRRDDTQSVMNRKIKFRESFRPFAPAVLEERIGDYFDLDRPSPYMLLVAQVNESRQLPMQAAPQASLRERAHQRRSDIPAVTHVDYSARIQSVSAEQHKKFYDVLKAFDTRTGCGVIVNTSFNVRGEPIVCTPQEAYRCFMRTDMDALVLEDFLLLKGDQPPFDEAETWREDMPLD